MKPSKLIAATVFALSFSGSALAALVDFETIDTSAGIVMIPNGYPGGGLALTWDRVWADNLSNVSPIFPGYVNTSGLSGNYAFAAYDLNFDPGFTSGFSSTGAFNFDSANVVAAYVGMTLNVQGFRTGNVNPIYSQDLILNPLDLGSGLHNFNFANINEVRFTVVGLLNPVDAEFALDNLQLTAVPLPASFYLLLTGLLGMVGVARRRYMPC